jgi:hypothetical protein
MKVFEQFYECPVTVQESAIWQLKCHLRIIDREFGQQIAIVSVQNCEIGWFVPSQLEQLATHIVRMFQLDPDRLTWIERDPHYASRPINTEYSEVSFDWHQGIATNPKWKAIANKSVESISHDAFTSKRNYFNPDIVSA